MADERPVVVDDEARLWREALEKSERHFARDGRRRWCSPRATRPATSPPKARPPTSPPKARPPTSPPRASSVDADVLRQDIADLEWRLRLAHRHVSVLQATVRRLCRQNVSFGAR